MCSLVLLIFLLWEDKGLGDDTSNMTSSIWFVLWKQWIIYNLFKLSVRMTTQNVRISLAMTLYVAGLGNASSNYFMAHTEKLLLV